MKSLTTVFAAGVWVILVACLGQEARAGVPQSCWDAAENQAALNRCAERDYREADAEMNRLYGTLMRTSDPAFKAALREAQRAWVHYRDAHIRSVYPDPKGFYGTIRPMCELLLLARLTLARSEELRRFIEPTEGDVCLSYPGPNSVGSKGEELAQ